VVSPYLKARREHLRTQFRQLCTRAASAASSDPTTKDRFASWLKTSAEFARTSPSGWKTPAVTTEKAAELQADGSVLLAGPSNKESKGKKGERWTFGMKPGAGGLARIRLELLPHPAHGGNVTRGNAESASVKLSASVYSPRSSKDRPLSFFLAEADFKEPRYFNGNEILGILEGWQSSKQRKNQKQSAIWYLDKPVELAADDELKIAVQTDSAGCIRLSLSPFGFDPDGRPGLDGDQRAALATRSDRRTSRQVEVVRELYCLATGEDSTTWSELRSLCTKLHECGDGRTKTMVSAPMPPLLTRVLPRGNWQDQSGPIVSPAAPQFLPQTTPPKAGRLSRLDLAHWITSPDNPLTARVFMNRLWKQLFGTGISGVIDDLGAQGEWPVHPELLDWMAIEFRDSGWNIKKAVKLLVTSATYRQDSHLRPELRDVDPNNRWLASQSPRRLEAEFVRDNALAIAGLLNMDIGGPSVFPYQPPGYYANLQFPDRDYIANMDDRQYRRGVYMHWQRTFLQPMLANFDAPPREECTAARTVANTPQQALTLLNDPTFVEAARVLAQSLLAKQGRSDADRLMQLYEKALARSPKAREHQSLAGFLDLQRIFYRDNPSEADQLLHVGLTPVAQSPDERELAAWTTVCRIIMNLHETITRY
jgi:hypothetical protein